jgi:hypothetical protein
VLKQVWSKVKHRLFRVRISIVDRSEQRNGKRDLIRNSDQYTLTSRFEFLEQNLDRWRSVSADCWLSTTCSAIVVSIKKETDE